MGNKRFDESTHFEPSWDEITVKGYELEINTWKGWVAGTFPDVLKENKELDEYGEDDIMKLAHAVIRVPYLTKEQIEAEGWKEVWSLEWRFQPWDRETNANKILECDFMLQYFPAEKLLVIDKRNNGHSSPWRDRVYQGECRCINDFRSIMKRLRIKKQ